MATSGEISFAVQVQLGNDAVGAFEIAQLRQERGRAFGQFDAGLAGFTGLSALAGMGRAAGQGAGDADGADNNGMSRGQGGCGHGAGQGPSAGGDVTEGFG